MEWSIEARGSADDRGGFAERRMGPEEMDKAPVRRQGPAAGPDEGTRPRAADRDVRCNRLRYARARKPQASARPRPPPEDRSRQNQDGTHTPAQPPGKTPPDQRHETVT